MFHDGTVSAFARGVKGIPIISYWSGCGSGTMQTVAGDGTGFKQKYGYIEGTFKFPNGHQFGRRSG